MKILYDHQILAWQTFGGISRYFFELMNQFSQIGEPQFELSLIFSKNHYLKSTNFRNDKCFFVNHNFPRKLIKIMSTINKIKSQKALVRQRFDIFHPTYYDPYFLKYVKGKPFVLTIYDMTHEILSSQYSNRDKTAENKKLLAQKAAKIIAISENTKKDILRFLPGFDERKIAVTYLANSLSKSDVPSSNFQIPANYIFFVGGRGKYKNFEFFIRSVRSLMAEYDDLNIVCAGGGPFSDFEKDVFESLGIKGRIHCYSVTDTDMAWLYQNALAFVFPSLYEGFGIPVLEAFACRCPVICSNTSSLPEVGGEAAVYFDPNNAESIREAVTKAIYNEELRQNLINRGLKRSQNFSWAKTAEKTESIYRSIL